MNLLTVFAFSVVLGVAFAAGFFACNYLKDKRAERAENKLRELQNLLRKRP